ncbi:Armadillo-type protein [Caenorhabditis elegans]|uniref:Armadillo-type protein n=2 Tax=Caenorhabditis elegans TaxID=6239 RepID=H2KMK6_CAEEL|nr:Armadillo-type protein [Caenorhabditis elegans]CCE72311.2 Armadillo-type protein [Caenorhabditis elegans]|eukprot:NP_001254352.2 Uncharacterized protein CELE_Y38E10A.22 [Caenorhabditis elegans]
MAASAEDIAWKKLLDMATAHSSKNTEKSAEASEDTAPVYSRENLEFLQKAMTHSFGGDMEQGPSVIQKFFHFGDENPEKVVMTPALLAAAKELADQLDDYLIMGNFSEHFIAEGGLKALANLTMSPDEDLRLLYLRLIPQLAENRPEFQQAIADSPLFTAYMKLLKRQAELSPRILSALLSAISSIVRSHLPAYLKFQAKNGLTATEKLIQSTKDHKNAVKAGRMIVSFLYTLTDLQGIDEITEEIKNSILKIYTLLDGRSRFVDRADDSEETKEFYEETMKMIKFEIMQMHPDIITPQTRKLLEEHFKESNLRAGLMPIGGWPVIPKNEWPQPPQPPCHKANKNAEPKKEPEPAKKVAPKQETKVDQEAAELARKIQIEEDKTRKRHEIVARFSILDIYTKEELAEKLKLDAEMEMAEAQKVLKEIR